MGKFRDWLSSNMIFRNILADLGTRSAYSGEPGGFIAYFQYKIGPYQRDYYLYFPKEPYNVRYHNEVFNKLFEYAADDIFKYLDFHFDTFPEKNAFVLFLDRQLTERLKKSYSKEHRIKLESAADWVVEKSWRLKIRPKSPGRTFPGIFSLSSTAKQRVNPRRPRNDWRAWPVNWSKNLLMP